MKQAIAAFLLCLSLVLGGVALAAHTLQEDAGQVAVTAISRQGDPAAAQGLVATQSCQYAQTLLWDLTIPLDRPAQSTTAFSAQGDVPAAANDDAGVYLRFPHQDVTLSAEPGYSLDNLPTSPALGPLYEQVARRTPPGQTRTEILDPSQFLDAYPLQVTWPGNPLTTPKRRPLRASLIPPPRRPFRRFSASPSPRTPVGRSPSPRTRTVF